MGCLNELNSYKVCTLHPNSVRTPLGLIAEYFRLENKFGCGSLHGVFEIYNMKREKLEELVESLKECIDLIESN